MRGDDLHGGQGERGGRVAPTAPRRYSATMLVEILCRATSALLVLLAVTTATPTAADPAAGEPRAERRVTARVHVASAAADSATLLWSFDLAAGWHLYGPFRNDTGLPPRIALDLPSGWHAGPLSWPVPERHLLAGEILDHVYHERLDLLQTVRFPAGARSRELTAELRWLVCADICVPGDTTLAVTLPAPAEPDVRDRHARAAAAVPGALPASRYTARRDPDRITLTVPGAARLRLLPDADGPLVDDLIRDGEVTGEVLVLDLAPGAAGEGELRALLSIDYHDGDHATGWITVP